MQSSRILTVRYAYLWCCESTSLQIVADILLLGGVHTCKHDEMLWPPLWASAVKIDQKNPQRFERFTYLFLCMISIRKRQINTTKDTTTSIGIFISTQTRRLKHLHAYTLQKKRIIYLGCSIKNGYLKLRARCAMISMEQQLCLQSLTLTNQVALSSLTGQSASTSLNIHEFPWPPCLFF